MTLTLTRDTVLLALTSLHLVPVCTRRVLNFHQHVSWMGIPLWERLRRGARQPWGTGRREEGGASGRSGMGSGTASDASSGRKIHLEQTEKSGIEY